MLKIVKWAIRACVLLILAVVSVALHELMPGHSTALAWLTFIGLWLAFSLAVVLAVVSITIGLNPGKSTLAADRKVP